MTISRHQREAEALAARLRAKNAAEGKRQARQTNKRPGGRVSRNAGSWIARGKSPASVVKIHKGGLAGDRYAESARDAEFISGNMLGRNWRERAPEWAIDQARHPSIKNLFVHASISLAGGNRFSGDQWAKFVNDWLGEIGADGVNYIAVRHVNSHNDHAHIVFSRALPNGSLLNTSHNFYKWRGALRRAEEKNGLKSFDIDPSKKEKLASQSDTQVNAIRRANRRGTPPNWIDPADIESCIARSTDFNSFAVELQRVGIEIRVSRKDSGEARGLIFKRKGAEEFLAGTSIDRKFSLRKIEAAFEAKGADRQRAALLHAQMLQQQRNAELARANKPNPNHPRERG